MGKTYKDTNHRPKKDSKKPLKKQSKQSNQQPKKWKFSASDEAEIYDDMRL